MSLRFESDWKFGGVDEAPQQSLIGGHLAFGGHGGGGQLVEILGAAVGQRIHLQPTPSVFDGVQFGGVRRKEFDAQPRVLCGEAADGCRAMHGKAIPEKYDGAWQMSQQLAQKFDRLRLLDRLAMQSPPEAEPTLTRTDREGADGRQMLVRAETLIKKWREARGRPRAADQGIQQNAGFIRENEVRPSRAVFF